MALPKLIVVLGTTACGKSGLGVELAKRFGGEIVSADSRQTISSLEKGRYNPSILLAFKIARCFGQSIEEIFLYEEDAQ